MTTLLHDLRYAARQLRKNPGFTLVAVLTLALGIGANTTVFSLTNAVFLRALPVQRPDRLVRIYSGEQKDSRKHLFMSSSYPDYLALRALGDVFSGVTTYGNARVSLGRGDASETVNVELVSGSYFSVLGVRPALGRAFLPEEDSIPNAHPVAVLSHPFWQSRFLGDSTIVGRTIVVNGVGFTVIGVAPQGFHGVQLERAPVFWVPTMMQAAVLPGGDMLGRDTRWLRMHARLRDGVSAARAQEAVTLVAHRLAAAYPETNEGYLFTIGQGRTAMEATDAANVKTVFALLSAVVALVLVIACANVANLLLARATTRRREFAVRLALGAGRWQIVRQLLAESVLLALLGGAVGALLAMWAVGLFPLLEIPATLDFSMDGRVLVFTFAAATLTGILFGLAPALQATGTNLSASLKDGSAGAGRSRSRLRGSLVVLQLSLSLMMLVVAGLLLRTLSHLQTANGGYEEHDVLVASLDPRALGYDQARGVQLYARLLDQVRGLPGVQSAALAVVAPLSGRRYGAEAVLPEAEQGRNVTIGLSYNVVSGDYFSTLGIPLRQGRAIGDADRDGAPRVAVVNEAMARRYWPGGSPLGKQIRMGGDDAVDYEIVGVSGDVKYENMTTPSDPMAYFAVGQQYHGSMTLHVRTRIAPGTMATQLRGAVHQLDPNLPLAEVGPLSALRERSMVGSRLSAALLSVFGALALLLAGVGLSGVVAYSVAQRTREIGVRLALGAGQPRVLRFVVAEGMRLALVGVAVGVVLSAIAARLVSGLLYGVGAFDLVTFAAVVLVLTLTALVASYLPALQATRVDPMVALRAE